MRRIILVMLLVTSLFATNYQSLHQYANAYGKVGAVNQLPFMASRSSAYTQDLVTQITAMAGNYNGEFCTKGWNSYKVYIPAGTTYFNLGVVTKPNRNFVWDFKFRGDSNPIVNHVDPTTFALTFKDTSLLHEFLEPSQVTMHQRAGEGAGSFVLYTDDLKTLLGDKGGWLYVDINENSANSSSNPYGVGPATMVIGYTIEIGDKAAFNAWLNNPNTKFLSNGDPVASASLLNINNPSCDGSVSSETVTFPQDGFSFSEKDWSVLNGEEVAAGSGTTTPTSTTAEGFSGGGSSGSGSGSTTVGATTTNTDWSATNADGCPTGYTKTDSGQCIGTGAVSTPVTPITSSGGSELPFGNTTGLTTTNTDWSSTTGDGCPSGYTKTDSGQCIKTGSGAAYSSSSSSSSSSSPQKTTSDEINLDSTDDIGIATARFSKSLLTRSLTNKALYEGMFIKYAAGSYDWIYIPVNTKKVYKLEGMKDNGNLNWLAIQDLVNVFQDIIITDGKKIEFKAANEDKIPSSDVLNVVNQLKEKTFDVNGYFIKYDEGAFSWMYITPNGSSANKLEADFKWTKIW